MRARCAIALAALCCGNAVQADSRTLSVSAVVLSRSNCRFDGASSLTLAFGNVNPASNTNATTTVSTTIRCTGSNPATFMLSAGDGQNAASAGNRRMRHGAVVTEFLPYSLTISPASATIPKNTTQLITITATIEPAQFHNARVGIYSDTVAITLNP